MKPELRFPNRFPCPSCATSAPLLLVYLGEFQNVLSEEKSYYLSERNYSLLLLKFHYQGSFFVDNNASVFFYLKLFLLF